jgi:hypothetical protein
MKALATWAAAPFLDVTAVEREDSRWLVTVFSRERACCRVCGVQSRSRHSVYSRTLGDLSSQGTPVTIRVRVGRWRCRNEQCDRQIFAERLPGIGASARQTDRLTEIVKLFGHSAGGRPSARLLAPRSCGVSSNTSGPRSIDPHSGSLVLTSGLGGRAQNSARLSWTWSVAVWWICWQIARQTRWQIGSNNILTSRSSTAIAMASMRTRPVRGTTGAAGR